MDTQRFDRLARSLTEPGTRRGLLALVASLPLSGGLLPFLDPDEVDAAGRRKRRKKRHKHGRGRHRNHRKPRKKCTPESVAQTCADTCGSVTNNCKKPVDCGACACVPACTSPRPFCVDDVCVQCTSSDQCPSGELCNAGSCVTCDVTCPGTATECGTTLRTAIAFAAAGATLRVCPGTYQGGFIITKSVTLIGAGQSDDPTSNTVLDGNSEQRVLALPRDEVTVTLQQLHIMRGEARLDGGGIAHAGARLVMQDCTVAGNRGRIGGGIAHGRGILEMTRCTVRDNVAPSVEGVGNGTGGGLRLGGPATLTDCVIANNESEGQGGGLFMSTPQPVGLAGTTVVRDNSARQGGGILIFDSTLMVGADCRITRNTANVGAGGGIHASGNRVQVTLEGPDPSPIVVDNCRENCVGNVPKCASGGTCPP